MSDYWTVLSYEIQMYFGARHLQGYPITRDDKILIALQTSALTEVKALHIRILVEMFLPRKNVDNINIDDLMPDWRVKNATIANDLEIAYTTALEEGKAPRWYFNKFLAHPDKRRGDHFDWSPIIRRMDPVLKAIFKTLPMEQVVALQYFKKYLFE